MIQSIHYSYTYIHIIITKSTVYMIIHSIYLHDKTGLDCKQCIVSGDAYHVPDSKLSASSVHSPGLGVIYSRLTNEHESYGGWGSFVLNQDQFIQVRFTSLCICVVLVMLGHGLYVVLV